MTNSIFHFPFFIYFRFMSIFYKNKLKNGADKIVFIIYNIMSVEYLNIDGIYTAIYTG